jgi:pyridoxamine 5'-phosphate oxidase
MSLRDRRVQYESAGLDVADVHPDPIVQWHCWYDEAVGAGLAEPNAMTLATVDDDGVPDGRQLLVREADERGLSFFTNYGSIKSRQLEAHPHAAIVFAWLELHRQVRIRGSIERLPDADSDAYFATRPRDSQIGAWASAQSEPLASRAELEAKVAAMTERFAGGDVPRPPFWGGWRLVPVSFEFWQGRPNRLHDRIRYDRAGDSWTIYRLSP